jgi:hypothetical protein
MGERSGGNSRFELDPRAYWSQPIIRII